jgi:hypothetical protein
MPRQDRRLATCDFLPEVYGIDAEIREAPPNPGYRHPLGAAMVQLKNRLSAC